MDWSGQVIGAAIEVHRALGPGHLESAYATCLGHELTLRAVPHERERRLPLTYKGIHLDAAYRLDFVVDGRLLVELKAVSELHPIHMAQVLTYMRIGQFHEALLINFNAARVKDGLRRLLL
jgi:GxxExxY protein